MLSVLLLLLLLFFSCQLFFRVTKLTHLWVSPGKTIKLKLFFIFCLHFSVISYGDDVWSATRHTCEDQAFCLNRSWEWYICNRLNCGWSRRVLLIVQRCCHGFSPCKNLTICSHCGTHVSIGCDLYQIFFLKGLNFSWQIFIDNFWSNTKLSQATSTPWKDNSLFLSAICIYYIWLKFYA